MYYCRKSFKERHCNHCLKKTYNKGEEDEYSIYYHYVLEAKLVVGDIVISLDSEFIENEKEEVEKQGLENPVVHDTDSAIRTAVEAIKILIAK